MLAQVVCPLLQIFPAHGAGSPCGKNISSDLYSTIGKEKLTNPALSFVDVSLSFRDGEEEYNELVCIRRRSL